MMSVCHSTGRKETINVPILSVYCMCVRVIRAEAHALVELGNYKLRSKPWIVVDWPVSVQFGETQKSVAWATTHSTLAVRLYV